MKKLLSCLLLLAVMATSFAFASAETTAVKGTTLFPCNEKGYPDLGGVTLTIWIPMDASMTEFIDTYSDLQVIKNLEEMFNVNLEFVHPPVGSEKEGFSTMLADQDYPDMIFDSYVRDYYAGGISMAYDDGLIYDYTDLVSEETTPHFYEKVLADPYLAKGAYDDYGRVIALGTRVSGSEESCTCMWGMMIRKDALEAVGLDVPVTIDDWTEMLRAFKENGINYPLLLNKSNYWRTRNAFSCAWNIDARNFFITEDGTVVYGPATQEYKDYLATMRLWYSEGLINPDFTTDTQTDTWAMLANEEAGCVVDHTYNYAANYYNVVEIEHPERGLVAAQMPKLTEDAPLTRVMVTNRNLDAQKYICASSEHKEECVAFLDALYLDDVEFMMSNGIEGKGYNLNDKGYPVITDVEYNADASVEDKRCMRLYQFETESDSDLDYILTSKYCYGVQPECVKLYVQCSYDGIWPFGCTFTTEESEILAEYRTNVETYRDEMCINFITGKADLDTEFDSYLEKLNELGLSEMQKVYEASYARYLAR